MQGISIAGRHLKITHISVKTDPTGICISGSNERDPSEWVCVCMTAACLWEMINLPHVTPGENTHPVPPFVPDEIDLTSLPEQWPIISLPALDVPPPLPPPPPKG